MMCNYLFTLLLSFDYLAYFQLFDIENHSLVDSIDGNIETCCDGGLVAKSCPTLVNPWTVVHQTPLYRIFPGRVLEEVAISFSRGSSELGIGPWSSALQADSLPAELPGKPKKDRIKGRGEQPDEEVHRARPERLPSAGAPVLVELGCDTLLARGSVGSSLNPNLGRLHHVGVIVD